jgi:hypothetical protein
MRRCKGCNAGPWLLAGLLLCSAAAFAAPDYRQQSFELPADTEALVVADVNADGFRDLITVIDNRLRVYFHHSGGDDPGSDDSGFNFESSFVDIPLQSPAVGWDISSGYSTDGSAVIITLLNGREARAWPIIAQQLQEPVTLAANLPGFLMRGVNRLRFSQDVNGDGLEDLVVPGAGVLHILIRSSNGDYQAPLSVQSEMQLRTSLSNNRFNRSAGQAVRIPRLELRDVNSDGSNDLISRTDESLNVFLANSGSNYFPSVPSYSLDIAEIEERLGEFDVDNLDFSNLTGVLALTHEEILDDVDNDGIEDLLLREGGKVSLFGGTASGMDLEQPRQVLRSGGNVLSTFLYDENDDGLKDLWLWRVESISVGDLFVWLALSGNIAIEAFVYPNDGERFARRPTRRVTVNLRFPSVVRLATAYQDLNSAADGLRAGDIPPHRPASLDGDAEIQDLLVLMEDRVDVFLDSVRPDADQDNFLGSLGYSRDRDDYEIDIREIIDNVDVSGTAQLTAVQDRAPDQQINLDSSLSTGDIIAARLNSDSVDDLFVFQDFDGSAIRGLLLLSK